MNVRFITAAETLCALLSGDIDHHSAKEIRREIDIAIKENDPKELILDFAAVTFMDSSGIGLVMGRYKLMNEKGGKLVIAKTPGYIAKVMRVSGVGRLAKIVDDYELTQQQEVMKIETTNQ